MTNATPIPISNITNFHFNHKQIRTTNKDDGSIWFVAKDVCQSLDIHWSGSAATLKNIPNDWRVVLQLKTTLKNQYGTQGFTVKDTIFINEPAVYKLAFRSNKPEADNFTNWVASEVLPTIRKTGSYSQEPEKVAQAFYDAGRKLGLGHNAMRHIVIEGTQNLSGVDISDQMEPPKQPGPQPAEPINKKLQQIRSKKKISQQQVSLKAFGSHGRYGEMERGNKPITQKHTDLILDVLGADQSELADNSKMQVPGNVFVYIPDFREYLEAVCIASRLNEEDTRVVGRFMGGHVLEVCLSNRVNSKKRKKKTQLSSHEHKQ